MNGKISIITPLFNRELLIAETWFSIQSQTYKEWEWIVVDDGSTDNSREVVHELSRKDERIKVFRRPDHLLKGPSSCRNFGVTKSDGAYLIFLDSDDLLSRSCLDKRLRIMVDNPGLDFAVFPMQYFKEKPDDSNKIFNIYSSNTRGYLHLFLSDNPPWQTMCPIWRKDSFDRLGGFREDYLCMEDPELHVKAIMANYRFQVVKGDPDCFYRHSFDENQASHQFWEKSIEGRVQFMQDVWNTYQGHEFSKGISSDLKIFLRRLIKYFLLARLKEYKNHYKTILNWAHQEKIISLLEKKFLDFTLYIFSSEYRWVKTLKLRGVIYQLI